MLRVRWLPGAGGGVGEVWQWLTVVRACTVRTACRPTARAPPGHERWEQRQRDNIKDNMRPPSAAVLAAATGIVPPVANCNCQLIATTAANRNEVEPWTAAPGPSSGQDSNSAITVSCDLCPRHFRFWQGDESCAKGVAGPSRNTHSTL